LLKHLEEITIHSLQHSRQLGFSPSAVGIATAGSVNPETGSIVYATENLPGWTGTRIAETIQASCGLPVHVENDANALAVCEKVFGAARAFDDFVCITLGTGVGGGCFIAGRLNHGSHFFGNAFGHVSIHPGGRPCTCGRNGCLEAYANAAALLEFAGHQFADPVNLLAAAHQGEPVALQALDTFASHLAIGCSLLVQLLDPEALILAGGLAQDNPLLLSLLEQKLSTLVSMWEKRRPQILASQAGYHAGVLGAAAVAAR
jgi:predicted NBD/HSP70 family sugar kinase